MYTEAILSKTNQYHLIKHLNIVGHGAKSRLIQQLDSLDWDQIPSLITNHILAKQSSEKWRKSWIKHFPAFYSKIIRNRLKVYGARKNARAFLEVQSQFGSFSEYIWGFVDGQPIQNRWKSLQEMPATTALSDTLSKDMKKRGFTFVG